MDTSRATPKQLTTLPLPRFVFGTAFRVATFLVGGGGVRNGAAMVSLYSLKSTLDQPPLLVRPRDGLLSKHEPLAGGTLLLPMCGANELRKAVSRR